jgi:MFS-type transporter involved in bile tolerance (Atg22 family)
MEAGGFYNSVHGIKVSSLLTIGNLIAGITAGVTMPLVGAIVDHTDHRKVMGAMSAFIFTACAGAQLIISPSTWFIVYILGIILGYFFIMHQVCVMAYLPDLTHDNTEMAHYTAIFMVRQYLVQGTYSAIIVAVAFGVPLVDLQTAMFSMALAFAIAVVLLGYAWTFLFRKRPKLREVPEGESILSTGFQQLWKTSKVVKSEYRALKWFMIALLWSPEAGAGTVLAIVVTFLSVVVKCTVADISLMSLVNLFANIPGAMMSKFMCKKINPLNSFRVAELWFAGCMGLFAYTVTGPETKNLVYLYAVLIGFSVGWMFPSQRTTVVAMVPKGQETEIMGLVSFFGQILGWLPSFFFTLMNEKGVDMRWGLSLIAWFLLMSFCCTLMCGSFETATAAVAHTSDAYLNEFARRSMKEGSFIAEEVSWHDGGVNGKAQGKEDVIEEDA